MNRHAVGQRISEIGIVPVVRASSARDARMAAEAVCDGGIPIVEITMTVPGAVHVIRDLVTDCGSKILIGAGTVMDVDSARDCVRAGAQFLVSPCLDLKTVEFAASEGVLMMAGALTPAEVVASWKAGSDFVKVFPCGAVGGPKYIRALRGPLPQIPLIPTGGVDLNTAADFINAGAAALGVGSELIQPAALKAGKRDVIAEIARKFVSIVKTTRDQMSAKSAESVAVPKKRIH